MAVGVLAGALLTAALALSGAGAANGTSPWWFEDGYTSSAYVDTTHTTAAVDTSGPGTVSLPPAPAALAFAPEASYAVVASALGLRGWAFNGAKVVRAGWLDVPGSYTGAAWISGSGDELALASATGITLEAWGGSSWKEVGFLPMRAINAVAEGAPAAGGLGSVLVGGPNGFQVVAYVNGALTLVPGAGVGELQDVAGIASAPGGAWVAVWQGAAVRVYGWDGTRYREVPAWEIPSGTVPVAAVAWFREGNGYWVLRADATLAAYGFTGSFPRRIPQLSTTLAAPAAVLGTGWRQGDVAALTPSGWAYLDGAPIAPDPARSVTGQALTAYAASAQLQSAVLDAGHAIDRIQVDATVTEQPPGTSIAYQVSTDGGATWTDVPACVNPTNPRVQCAQDNTAVPAGSRIVYRLLLSTSDPSATPVVDATALYEIATRISHVATAEAVLVK